LVLPLQGGDHVAGAVAAHVVHEDDLVGTAQLLQRVADLGEAGGQDGLLVVAGEDDAHLGAGTHPPVSDCLTAAMTRSTSKSPSRGCSGRRTSGRATRSVTGRSPAAPSSPPKGREASGTEWKGG